jgi:alpha-beta hydrolase superfamily lysophospholipase
MRKFRNIFFVSALLLCLSGCTSLFFAPQKKLVLTPDRIGLAYQDLMLTAADGTSLHAWLLPARAPRQGRVLFLHGNGENMSTHIASVYWLPDAGYDVLLLDYRGYGRSGGSPALPDVLQDVDAAWQALHKHTDSTTQTFVLGQSLGAALAYQWSSTRHPSGISGMIYDSGFARYPDMVKRVLRSSALTRWVSTPLSWLFSHANDPQRVAAQQPAMPRLFLHSREDSVVPVEQGELLYQANTHNACLIEGAGPHIAMPQQQKVREMLLGFMRAPTDWVSGCAAQQQLLSSKDPVWVPLPPLR